LDDVLLLNENMLLSRQRQPPVYMKLAKHSYIKHICFDQQHGPLKRYALGCVELRVRNVTRQQKKKYFKTKNKIRQNMKTKR